MLGPSGMGGLWGREELLIPCAPSNQEDRRSRHHTTMVSNGPQHLPSLRWPRSFCRHDGDWAAIDYLTSLDMEQIHEHEIHLNRIMSDGVKDLDGVSIIGPEDASKREEFVHCFLMRNFPHMTSHCFLTRYRASWFDPASTVCILGSMTEDTMAH